MHREEETVVQIRSLGHSGEGVGSLEGYTLFIEGALTGEKVSFRLTEKKRRYGRGELLAIVSPSPDRISPICPLFSRCGGCQLMHLSYEAQLRFKRERVLETLRRIGKIEVEVAACEPSPLPLYYRNKIQMPVQSQDEDLLIGFYAKHSHRLIDVETCYIHSEIGQSIYAQVRSLLKRFPAGKAVSHLLIKTAFFTKEALVVLVTQGNPCDLRPLAEEILLSAAHVKGVVQSKKRERSNVVLGEEFSLLAGSATIEEKILGLRFKVSAASFFQVNPLQAEALYRKALELAAIQKSDHVLDAFCGVGTLALLAAQSAQSVVGVECVAEAIEDAKENAALNGLSNVKFVCSAAEEWLKEEMQFDVALLNPPRQGCDSALLTVLAKCRIRRLVYISCDPATLARDLAQLVSLGYFVEAVFPFDMFPQTAHVETVVKLQLMA